jgi:hypothetical protein
MDDYPHIENARRVFDDPWLPVSESNSYRQQIRSAMIMLSQARKIELDKAVDPKPWYSICA